MNMMPYQSFLLGYKPACFENLDRLNPKTLEKLRRYPFHKIYEKTAIFFQNETLKDQFLRQTQNLSPNSPEYCRVLGLALGFPPKAVEFYVDYYRWQLHDRENALTYFFSHKVGYRYIGIMFEGHINNLFENTQWLWDRYGIEQDMAIKVIQKPEDDLIEFPVRFRNTDDLLRVEKDVRKILEHNRNVMTEKVYT